MKTLKLLISPFIVIFILLSFTKTPEIGPQLAICLNNNIYNKFDSLAFDSVFIRELAAYQRRGENFNKIKYFYKSHGYKPTLILNFFGDKSLDSLVKYLNNSADHGFEPESFNNQEIAELINTLRLNNFSSVDKCYPLLARLEILSADALTRYSNYLKFGLINPKAIYPQYSIKLRQADSLFTTTVLTSDSILDDLRGLQLQSLQYKTLQQGYLTSKNDSIKKILAVNMERLRWKLPNTGERYIQVNIPDFRLVYFNGSDTLTSMKVCVGRPRDVDYDKKWKVFQKTGNLEDKPQNHETPLIFSTIKKLCTNPVWNIPKSIAETEVYHMARRNSSYLRKKKIEVYYKNNLIKNPSSIRWGRYDRNNLPFLFVQQPGIDNVLGRLKFIFPNNSSIYLHDTNFKQGFKLANRAVSHGCIRLEKPLQLAQLLADTAMFNDIKKELQPLNDNIAMTRFSKNNLIEKQPKLAPILFVPKAETPLLITYFTAWAQNNKIDYRPDIYEMDEKLWVAMKKIR